MVRNIDNDEGVDFDEDNYSEESDDDVEKQMEEGEERVDGITITNGDIEEVEEEDEEEVDESEEESEDEEENEDTGESDGMNKRSVEDKEILSPKESEPYDEQGTFADNDRDREKHAELLALPPHGSEVFIGGLPRDTLEGDLRDQCESIGDIYEIRFVKNKDTHECKGYAFVLFTARDAAQKAIEELHNKLFQGKTLRCSLSEAKHRLFIGNVPKSMTEDEFRKVIERTGPGSETIELMKDPQNPSQNRGYAFVEYYNTACADYSRQKMTSENYKLYGNTPTVNWVDKKITSQNSSVSASASAASQVKSLYVKNIPDNISTDEVKELFQQHGEITRVVMPPSRTGSGKRDFAFIHYVERSSALKAVKDGEKHEINGQVLEVALANPQNDKKSGASPRPHNSGSRPNYILPNPGYGGFAASPYASMGGGYGVAPMAHQPMIFGGSQIPAGAHMVPMVLPDGQIAYVLQQPGMQMAPQQPARRNDRNSGHRNNDDNRGKRYRPY